jgi:hypothetical protein
MKGIDVLFLFIIGMQFAFMIWQTLAKKGKDYFIQFWAGIVTIIFWSLIFLSPISRYGDKVFYLVAIYANFIYAIVLSCDALICYMRMKFKR